MERAMASVNKVILVGNLGADPELRYTPSGQPVCELRLATDDSYTGKDGQKVERTEWHRIEVWGKNAENCKQYLAKGRQVYVEGRLRTQTWDDKDGNKRYTTKIVSDRVVFLRGDGEARGTRPGAASRPRLAGVADEPHGGEGGDDFGGPPVPFGGGDDNVPF
jgi:single-strand DNA-binding protein